MVAYEPITSRPGSGRPQTSGDRDSEVQNYIRDYDEKKKGKNYGCCTFWQWGFGYHYPDHFVKSQYTFNQVFYIVFRIHMFLFVLANLIGRILWYHKTTARYFMLYITNWAMVSQVLFNMFDMILVLIQLEKKRRYPWDFLVNRDMTFFHGLSWFWNNINVNMSLFVTFFYWIFVNPKNPEVHLYFKLYANCFMAFLNVLDVWFSAKPWRIQHFWCTWLFALCYGIFSVVYRVMGGKTEELEDNAYFFMDWGDPVQAAAVIGVCCAVILLIQVVIFSMYHLRLFFAQRCCTIPTKHDVDDYYREYRTFGPIKPTDVEETVVFVPAPVAVVTGDEPFRMQNETPPEPPTAKDLEAENPYDPPDEDEVKPPSIEIDSDPEEEEAQETRPTTGDDGMYPEDNEDNEDNEEEKAPEEREEPEEPEEPRWENPFLKEDDEDNGEDSNKVDEEEEPGAEEDSPNDDNGEEEPAQEDKEDDKKKEEEEKQEDSVEDFSLFD